MRYSSFLILLIVNAMPSCAVTSSTSQDRLRIAGMRECTARDVVDDHCVEQFNRTKPKSDQKD